MKNYLPQHATIDEACAWLSAETGEVWTQPRLLESNLTPWFWIDYDANHPYLFGGKIEGYLARMVFQGDIARLGVERSTVRVNMFTTHDGEVIKVEPGVCVALSDLRYLRCDLEAEALLVEETVQAAQTPEVEGKQGTIRGATKHEVATAFDGLLFDHAHWLRNLASPPKWLVACRVCLGSKTASALWNPAVIALALLDRGVDLKKLDAAFTHLKEWRGEWREKSSGER